MINFFLTVVCAFVFGYFAGYFADYSITMVQNYLQLYNVLFLYCLVCVLGTSLWNSSVHS